MKINESYLARRRFLCGMLGGGAAALGASVAVPLAPYVRNLREEPLPEWLEIEKADYELAPGTANKVKYGPRIALLIQTPEPESVLKVFDAECTHLDCKVNYEPGENRIVCHCHKGYFHVDGRVMDGPPPAPLREFYHAFRSGKLVIAMEKENLEKAFQDS